MGIFGRKQRRRQAGPPGAMPPREVLDNIGPDDSESRWIYEYGGDYVSDTWSPPESIVRWWRVNRHGDVVEGPVEGEYFGTPKDDFDRATAPEGPLNWMIDSEDTIRGWLTVVLGRISPDITLHWVKVTDTPLVLAGHAASDFAPPTGFDGPPPPRIGVAVPVGIGVQMKGHSPRLLWGLLLWVTVTEDGADQPRQNVWLRPEFEADRADESLRVVLQAPDAVF